mmetsp:Transcript_53181/g.110924  ORF Transcript_53181/g.110924 Transcript_53181/m.110924 type:complete len:92 (-) Transcript_53181:303-578(-)
MLHCRRVRSRVASTKGAPRLARNPSVAAALLDLLDLLERQRQLPAQELARERNQSRFTGALGSVQRFISLAVPLCTRWWTALFSIHQSRTR